jgi:N-acetylglucosamine kinase-like BadF-type ATPase
MRNTPVFIGIDGGGTRSLAIAVDPVGRLLASAESGSLNFFGTSLPSARRNLKVLSELLKQLLPPRTPIDRIVVGCAALFSDATKAEKEDLCRGILPLERTRVVSDCQTACFGATLGRPGVVIVAGTGSIVVAQNEDGQHRSVGGWGHILGDAGSAYWIALESVKAAIASEEGLGPKTKLGRLVRQWFKIRKLTEIVPIVHGREFTKERFAMLASHLARKVGPRDAVFGGICQRGGRALAAQALMAVKLARLKTRPLPVYLIGGVLANNALVREGFARALKNSCDVSVAKPRLSPLLGAAALALRDAGVELTVEVVANLEKSDLGATADRSDKPARLANRRTLRQNARDTFE